MADYEVFELGNVVLQSGLTLRNATLAYKTVGTLNRRKDKPTVCLEVMSLMTSSCGYNRDESEPRVAP